MQEKPLSPVIPQRNDIEIYIQCFFLPWILTVKTLKLGRLSFRPITPRATQGARGTGGRIVEKLATFQSPRVPTWRWYFNIIKTLKSKRSATILRPEKDEEAGSRIFEKSSGTPGRRIVASVVFDPANDDFGTNHPLLRFNLLEDGKAESVGGEITWRKAAEAVDVVGRDLAWRRLSQLSQVIECSLPLLHDAPANFLVAAQRDRLLEELYRLIHLSMLQVHSPPKGNDQIQISRPN